MEAIAESDRDRFLAAVAADKAAVVAQQAIAPPNEAAGMLPY